MPITLNGSTGITTPTDTATTSVTTPLLTSPTATALTIQSAGTTALTVDTSQNVGVGTTSPSSRLAVNGGTSTSQIRWEVNNAAFTQEVSTNAAVSAYVYKSNDASYHIWKVASSEQMRLNSSGKLLVGTTTAASGGGVVQNIVGQGSSDGGVQLTTGTGVSGGGLAITSLVNGGAKFYSFTGNSGSETYTERMRLNADGVFIVGANTTSTATGVTRFETIGTTGGGINDWGQCIRWNGSGGLLLRAVASSATALYFESGAGGTLGSSPGTNVGSITVSSTNTAFNTSSDYRLKYDITPLADGLQTVCALKPSSYKWVVDDSFGNGFIAHELAEVIPSAVSGDKDAVNEDGSIRPQGVDYSKIVVHLVAAIQELKAHNDALEARLAALEAK